MPETRRYALLACLHCAEDGGDDPLVISPAAATDTTSEE